MIYIIRHCAAQGQSSDCELTENGLKQAKSLAYFFNNVKIDRIISSPFFTCYSIYRAFKYKKECKD